jgi:hypothetical protein
MTRKKEQEKQMNKFTGSFFGFYYYYFSTGLPVVR